MKSVLKTPTVEEFLRRSWEFGFVVLQERSFRNGSFSCRDLVLIDYRHWLILHLETEFDDAKEVISAGTVWGSFTSRGIKLGEIRGMFPSCFLHHRRPGEMSEEYYLSPHIPFSRDVLIPWLWDDLERIREIFGFVVWPRSRALWFLNREEAFHVPEAKWDPRDSKDIRTIRYNEVMDLIPKEYQIYFARY